MPLFLATSSSTTFVNAFTYPRVQRHQCSESAEFQRRHVLSSQSNRFGRSPLLQLSQQLGQDNFDDINANITKAEKLHDINTTATSADAKNIKSNGTDKPTESGWVTNFGRYLLPPSWSLKTSNEDNVDVSTYDPNSREIDPIFLEGSSFPSPEVGDSASEECVVDDDVIDVECYVEEEEVGAAADGHEENVTSAAVQEKGYGNTEKQRDESKPNLLRRLKRSIVSRVHGGDSNSSSESSVQSTIQVASNTTTSNETTQVSEEKQPGGPGDDQQEPRTSYDDSIPTNQTVGAHIIPERQKRTRRGKKETKPPIFHSLETNDIDTSTQSKQRKWQRRRKRAVILLKTVKNAGLLFVLTFLFGNVMNQFVDLDENGSFEVHFGKALSSSSSQQTLAGGTGGMEKISRVTQRTAASRSNRQSEISSARNAQTLGLVSRAVRKVGPAVVRVETETDVDSDTENGDPYKNGEDRGDIFDGVPEAPPQSDDHNKVIDFGQGSGMIIKINNEYHILTNAHVVDGANRVYVLLTDGRKFQATLLGNDDIVDIAVLKIIVPDDVNADDESDATLDLPFAEFGDSDTLEVGTFVTAIGSPGGLDNSCTIGIVSGLKRCPKVVGIPDKAGVLQYIQTDAAINQGNSGGPLVDVESGDIIGINTCIRANMEGTSFAIPINKVMGILDDLYEGRHITHGYLGVQMSTMSPTLARYHNKMRTQLEIPERDGVMIEKVFKKSPAEVGGLKKYDFVCTIDGQPVANADDAHLIIDQAPIGEDLSLTLLRGDSEITVQVKPEDLSVRLRQLREERLKKKTKP